MNHICVATSSQISYPLLHFLHTEGKLAQVVVAAPSRFLVDEIRQVVDVEIVVASEDGSEFPANPEINLVIMMAYPYRVQVSSELKMINVHFGPLPENRGPDPLFWTLKNGKSLAYIAIHEVTSTFDTGDVLKEKGYSIIPGETMGMLAGRLAHFTVELIREVLSGDCMKHAQEEGRAVYHKLPADEDITINWEAMSVPEIECLVNACNPKFGGAKAMVLGMPMRILEVSRAQVNLPEDDPLPVEGTVVHASEEHGLFVYCKGGDFLRLSILSTMEGVFSGNKLVAMNMKNDLFMPS